MSSWRCQVPGPPVAKGRPRATVVHGRPRLYTPKKTASWERMAAAIFRESWGGEIAHNRKVLLTILAIFPRPKRLSCAHVRKPCSCSPIVLAGAAVAHDAKPDLSNVIKAVEDALVLGGVLADDSLVSGLSSSKIWAAEGEAPRVEVVLTF